MWEATSPSSRKFSRNRLSRLLLGAVPAEPLCPRLPLARHSWPWLSAGPGRAAQPAGDEPFPGQAQAGAGVSGGCGSGGRSEPGRRVEWCRVCKQRAGEGGGQEEGKKRRSGGPLGLHPHVVGGLSEPGAPLTPCPGTGARAGQGACIKQLLGTGVWAEARRRRGSAARARGPRRGCGERSQATCG